MHISMRCLLLSVFFLMLLPLVAFAQDQTDSNKWPREISTAKGTVVIYQPQPETLDGNILKGRAAVALEFSNKTEPVFGAFWFEARLETDRHERTATITDLNVTDVRFPDGDGSKSAQFRTLVEQEIPKWDLVLSMDSLLATLELAENQKQTSKDIQTKPPTILFAPEPTILVSIDGEPRLKKEADSNIMRVINTAFTILLNPENKTYYLNADAKSWYQATDINGPWSLTKNIPSAIGAKAPKPDPQDTQENQDTDAKQGPAPKIVVATSPTELIATTGEPEYSPISGTDLLYLSNSDSDAFMHISSQKYYILLAGRWYESKSMNGPWQYVAGSKLPSDFAKIPEDSDMSTVLYAVPGTAMAKDAVLDAQLPQTATVDRKKSEFIVQYDGTPKFEDIPKTKLTYAVNTATPVIKFKKKYYACDDAIWFTADKPTGKWLVATEIPGEIYTIPPESPLYNVTFVKIYSSTPEVVYVGYTPGYTNTYIYNTTVVYGTGYYYPYWYGAYYYPRPATWGYCVRYSPYGGWRFGFSYSSGPFTFYFGRGWYGGGYWGPARYRGYRHGYRHGYRAGARAGYRAGQHNSSRNNMYRNKKNKARTRPATRKTTRPSQAGNASNRKNNVYADKKGNVHRKNGQNWEQRKDNGWQSSDRTKQQDKSASRPSTKPSKSTRTRQSSQTNRSSNLDRSHKARQHGSQRSQNFQRSANRGGGGRSGGGRRR